MVEPTQWMKDRKRWHEIKRTCPHRQKNMRTCHHDWPDNGEEWPDLCQGPHGCPVFDKENAHERR